MKYTWNYDPYAEIWEEDVWDTVGECIEQARRENVYGEDEVYVGEVAYFKPWINGEEVLIRCEAEAENFAGEMSKGWNPSWECSQSEIDVLSEELTQVLVNWLKRLGQKPDFYRVENIKLHMIK